MVAHRREAVHDAHVAAPRIVLRLFVLFLVALTASGCTGAFADDPVCEGVTGPISPETVEASLVASGFTVERLGRSSSCGGIETVSDQIVVHLSNEHIGSYDERHETEGGLDCLLRRTPIWGSKLEKNLRAGPNSPIYSGEHAWFHVQNVECTMYPGGDDPEAQVARLDEAMTRLAAPS